MSSKVLQTIEREALEIAPKVTAQGLTAGATGVVQLLAQALPGWHEPSWLVVLISVGAGLIAGYIKGDTVGVELTGGNLAVTDNGKTVATESLSGVFPGVAAVIAAQSSPVAPLPAVLPAPSDVPVQAPPVAPTAYPIGQ